MLGKRVILICSIALFSKSSFATGCDPCIMASVTKADAAISAALQTLNTTTQKTITATDTVNQTISASSSALTGVHETNKQLITTAIDGARYSISANFDLLLATIKNSSEAQTSQLKTLLKGIAQAESVANYEIESGVGLAQPTSLFVAGNRADDLKHGIIEKTKLLKKEELKFDEWLSLSDSKDLTNSVRTKFVNSKVNEFSPLLDKMNNSFISTENGEQALELIRYLVNSTPKPRRTPAEIVAGGQKSIEAEIKRVKKDANDKLIHNILASTVLEKMPLIDTKGWTEEIEENYTLVNKNEDGFTSLEEIREAETIRKLLSETWIAEVGKKTSASALREQALQGVQMNQMLNELIKQEEQALLLLGTMALE